MDNVVSLKWEYLHFFFFLVISIILPGGKQLISPLTEKYVLKKQQIIGLIIGINLTHTLMHLSNRLKQTKEYVSRTLLQKKMVL